MGQRGRGLGGPPTPPRERLLLALWWGPCGGSSQPVLALCCVGSRLAPQATPCPSCWRIKPHTLPEPHSRIFLAAGCGRVTVPASASASVGQDFGEAPYKWKSTPTLCISSVLLPEQRCDGRGPSSCLNQAANSRQKGAGKERGRKAEAPASLMAVRPRRRARPPPTLVSSPRNESVSC